MRFSAKSKKLQKEDMYALLMPEKSTNMRDLVGENVLIDKFCVYEEVNELTGQIDKVLAIQTVDGEIVVSSSKSCIRDFEKMHMIFGDVKSIYVYSEMSNNMQEVIHCKMGQ